MSRYTATRSIPKSRIVNVNVLETVVSRLVRAAWASDRDRSKMFCRMLSITALGSPASSFRSCSDSRNVSRPRSASDARPGRAAIRPVSCPTRTGRSTSSPTVSTPTNPSNVTSIATLRGRIRESRRTANDRIRASVAPPSRITDMLGAARRTIATRTIPTPISTLRIRFDIRICVGPCRRASRATTSETRRSVLVILCLTALLAMA